MPGERKQIYNVNVEDETAFDVENGSHTWSRLFTIENTLEYDFRPEVLDFQGQRQALGRHHPEVGTQFGRTFSFDVFLHGLGTAAGDGVTPTQTPFGLLLLSLLGTEVVLTGDTVAALPVPGADGFDLETQTSLTVAGVVWVGVAITGLPVPEWRPCLISGGSVTPLYNYSTSPAIGDVVQGSISYQLSNDVDEANDSFQAQVLTDRSDHKYLALGCMMDKLAMSFQAAGLPTAKASIMAASASDGESDALGTPSKPPVYPWMGAHAIIAPHGDPTYDAGDAYALKGQNTCELMRGLQNSQNPNSLQGYDGYDTVLSDFLTAAVNVPMDDKWADEWGASPGGGGGAEYQLMLSNTRVAGSFFGVYGSKVLQSDKPKDSDEGGILQSSLSFALDTTWDNSGVVVGVA